MLEQKLEIEFKNLLTATEYQQILTEEFLKENIQFTQTNHYFDTKDQLLKKQGAALRIRTTENFNELTFKVPAGKFLMETNLTLTDKKVAEILSRQQLALDEVTDQLIDLNLEKINIHTPFLAFNTFTTTRIERPVGNHLIVLDATTFQNGTVDYELELESLDAEEGHVFFNSILEKYAIPLRPALPKIARAERNRK